MASPHGSLLPTEDVALRIPRYLNQARHYLANTEQLSSQGDHAKAGEALWGAAASALKALQLVRQGRLLGRGEIDQFGKEVARDVGMVEAFAAIRALHANFYDPFRDADDVLREAAKGMRFVAEVLRIAESHGPVGRATSP